MRFLLYSFFLFLIILPSNSISKEAIVFSETFSNLLVKLAKTEEEKQKGLMFVNKLSKTNGLLLLYKKPKIVKIWMHNTQIPLDIIFINDQNKVVLIKKGEPFSKKIISSVTHVIGVLEIPDGCVKKLDIKVGGKISWRVVNKTKVKNIRYYHCLDHF
ncbi:MAG: hypothetical protein CMM92_00405 [Rickettsiales bacterium]|nr:hypothetical protein [Rickettsiales bacterium]